jgi:hypothetical protein
MSPDFAQRRRVALAAAITSIAVPAVLLLDRGGDASEQVVGTVVSSVVQEQSPTGDDAARATAADGTDAMGTSPAALLEDPATPLENDPATIAIPRLPDAVAGEATFSYAITNVLSCQVHPSVGAPFGAAITVTNLDNSQSVQCFNNIGGPEPDAEIVLPADAFSRIGDLTDAPVPVQLTW